MGLPTSVDRPPPLQVLAYSLALGAPNLLGPEPSQDTSLPGGPDPLQQALPAPRDPPRARRAWGKLVWQQPGACGLGSGQGWTSLFEGSPSLGRCHMAALISAGGAHAPWGDGRLAGVTSSLQEPWSLGGSDRGARKRAARGASAAAGRSWVAPPGPVLGGQQLPTALLWGSPSSTGHVAAGLLAGQGATARAEGSGSGSAQDPSIALGQLVPAPCRLAAPQTSALVNVKARQTSVRLALPPPQPLCLGPAAPAGLFFLPEQDLPVPCG